MLNVSPIKIIEFKFEGNVKRLLNVSFYLEGLHAVLKSTTKLMHFGLCNFSCSELQSIFIAAKHVEILGFWGCKLDVTDEFDIKEKIFKTKELRLRICSRYSRWGTISDGLEILMRAVAHSSLKHSLRKIEIWEEWLMNTNNRDEIKEIFERHDLQDVLDLI